VTAHGGAGKTALISAGQVTADPIQGRKAHDQIMRAGCNRGHPRCRHQSIGGGLPTEAHKLLPAALAVKAGQTAIATCKGQSYNVLVAVAERSGLPQLLIAKRVAGGVFSPAVFDTQPVAAVGGLPVKVGEESIAGIGSVVLPAATRTKPAPRQVWPRSLTG
jgi:hypothetical protein